MTYALKAFLEGLLLISLGSGCVYFHGENAHPFWPKPGAAKDLGQFDGVYLNHSLDAKTGEATENGDELFDFISGQGHSHGNRGIRAEVISAADGSSLSVRLYDQQNREIDSATLQRGKDFALTGGALDLYGPFSGWRDDSGNFGHDRQYQRDNLRLAAKGGLLGHESGRQFGLLFDFIPVASTSERSMFWPRLAK